MKTTLSIVLSMLFGGFFSAVFVPAPLFEGGG
jgi:hypothetical protein